MKPADNKSGNKSDNKSGYFQRFQDLAVNRMAPGIETEKDSLTYWRVRILFAIILTGLVIGLFAVVPANALAIKKKLWGLLFFNVVAWTVGISLLLSRRLRYEIRAVIVMVFYYALGLVIIISIGPLSGGPVWLFTFAVLVGVLLGTKAAIIALTVNAITLTITGWLISAGIFGQTFPFFTTMGAMIVAGANFMLLNTIAAISVAILVKGLISTHQKEEALYNTLEKESFHLKAAKKKLELEVDERLHIEKALRESEEKHRLLAENTVDCIWKMNLDMEITYINQAVFSFFGYTPEEWIGKLSRHCSPEEMERMQALFSGVLLNLPDKAAEIFETSLYHKNGKEIPCEITGKIVLNDAGNPIYCQGTTRNITERKRAEKMLMESNDRQRYLHSMIRLMCDNLPDLIWTKDLENKYIFANKACCEKLLNARDTNEPVGKTDMYFATREKESHPENPEYHTFGETRTDSDSAVLESKKSLRFEEFGNLKEKFICLDVYKAPFYDEKGNLVGTVGCARDITRAKEIEEEQKKAEEERIKLEAQLRQAQKMEAIGTLAGGIVHDFNNLLTTIIGNAKIALMDVIKDESLREGIEDIKKAGDKAVSLTRQLLAFSRKQVIKPDVLDLNEVINDTEKMLKRLITEDIEFQTILEPELWEVHMDPGQIDQMIINMVVNSRDAMPQGGKLVIETANVHMDENYYREHGIDEAPGSYVMLAISDTGSGMNKKIQEHIFEPFYTTKEIGKGTGLGLSTVYGIVKQNNGFIWVYSEPGQGTAFKIYLPKMKEGVEPEEKERIPVGDLNGSETVFIVENDDWLRNLTRKILERYGYSVLKAENGEDALRVSEAHDGSIDLLLTDVVMPKMGGKQVAERLQHLYPQMKVIYMSGYTDDTIIHHGVLEQGLNFLEKPFTPEGLARKMREVLDAENEK